MVNASPELVWSFVALAILVAAAFVALVHRAGVNTRLDSSRARRDSLIAALAIVAWMTLTFALAASGRLSFTSRPPTMGLLIALGLVLAFVIGASRFGLRLATHVPLAALIGVQAFRFPLELMLHRAYVEGLMPVQMTYSGFNFDILTGLSAIVVAIALVRRPGSLVIARLWNAAGILLLANILTIAILSTPTAIRVFHNEPANDWIARAPWVWLPSVFVVAAVLGHVLVFRRLWASPAAPSHRPSAISDQLPPSAHHEHPAPSLRS